MTSKTYWKNIEYQKVDDGFLIFFQNYTIFATTGRPWTYYDKNKNSSEPEK